MIFPVLWKRAAQNCLDRRAELVAKEVDFVVQHVLLSAGMVLVLVHRVLH